MGGLPQTPKADEARAPLHHAVANKPALQGGAKESLPNEATTGRVCSRVWHEVTAGAADGRSPTQRREWPRGAIGVGAKRAARDDHRGLTTAPRITNAGSDGAMPAGAFFFLIQAKRDSQAPMSRQRDGTGLQDGFWVCTPILRQPQDVDLPLLLILQLSDMS